MMVNIKVIKAIEEKIESLHKAGVIYCDHDQTCDVAHRLVDAIRGMTLETEIRRALRNTMRTLCRQEWVLDHDGQTHQVIADVVIAAHQESHDAPGPEIES